MALSKILARANRSRCSTPGGEVVALAVLIRAPTQYFSSHTNRAFIEAPPESTQSLAM